MVEIKSALDFLDLGERVAEVLIFGEVLINRVSLILIKSDLVAMSLILIRKSSRRKKIKKSSLKEVDWKIEVYPDL